MVVDEHENEDARVAYHWIRIDMVVTCAICKYNFHFKCPKEAVLRGVEMDLSKSFAWPNVGSSQWSICEDKDIAAL